MNKMLRRCVDVATAMSALGALALVALSFANWRTREYTARGGPPVTLDNWRSYTDAGHRLGSPSAAVTIIEFGDYQCPSCRVAYPHIAFVLKNFRASVTFLDRHWPLPYHEAAYPAARATECADRQGRFWEYHELLYTTAGWLSNPTERLGELGAEAGIRDHAAFLECIASREPVAAVDRDIEAAARAGGRGTPTVIVNDRLIRSFPDSVLLRELVEAALERGGIP